MFSAGSVSATLRGDFSPAGFFAFDAAMKRSGALMNDAEKKMSASGSRMSKSLVTVGKAGAVVAGVGILAFGAAIAKSVSLAADFEAQLSRLKATTGAGAANMDRLKKSAMAAGAATKFSALDAAKAQVELAKGGLSVQQILDGGLNAALALAAAGELDLAEAAATTVNAMKLFNISGSESMHVADALSSAANNTTADVHDFAMALTQGGGAAKAAGLSFDETIVALEAMAQAGIKGSDAGTSLKTALAQVVNPTDKQANAMKRLGLEFFDAQGSMRPLPELAEMLKTKLGGLTREQRLAALQTIAGTDGFRTLLSLYEQGGAGIDALAEKTGRAGDAAATSAEKQDNLRGKIENLKGSLETAGISLGEGLLGPLKEGAGSLTDTINEMVDSGALEKLGQDLGEAISGTLQALPGMFDTAKSGLDTFLGVLSTINDAVIVTLKGINLVNNALTLGMAPDIDTGQLERGNDRINEFRENLRGPAEIKVTANVGAALKAFEEIDSRKIKAKVARILADGDRSTSAKIKAIVALGIPRKTAEILTAGVPQTLSDIAAVRGAIAGVQGKTVTLRVNKVISELVDRSNPSTLSKTKPRATGRGPGGEEIALTGEGRGPELVGNAADGWQVVNRPTLMALGEDDYVVPFGDPTQSGRALGLMLDMLGIKGYHKGKKGHTHKKGGKGAAKPLPIPDAVKFAAVPEDALQNERDRARDSYQKRKERVRDLDVDIREQRKKVSEAKGADAKRKATRKLRDLQDDRRNYQSGTGGVKSSLSGLRKRYQDLQAQVTALHKANLEIERLNAQQEAARAQMETAAKTGDAGGWTDAKKRRGGLLASLRDLYARAVKYAKPDSTFAAELESKLAGAQGDIADLAGEAFEAADPFEGTGMTKAERDQLAAFEAAQSLAALTTPLDDDVAAATNVEQFLSGMLAAAQSDPARGGATAIRDIADRLKSARDNLQSLTGGSATNDNADLQAQIEQQRTRADTAERNAQINAQALSVFQGAGDIGMGGPRIVQNFSMLVAPTDPAQLAAVGDAAVGGMSQQAYVPKTRTNLGF